MESFIISLNNSFTCIECFKKSLTICFTLAGFRTLSNYFSSNCIAYKCILFIFLCIILNNKLIYSFCRGFCLLIFWSFYRWFRITRFYSCCGSCGSCGRRLLFFWIFSSSWLCFRYLWWWLINCWLSLLSFWFLSWFSFIWMSYWFSR